jgi:hypothetical protein
MIDTRSASQYLKNMHGVIRAPATLAKLRSVGGGPEFRYVGRSVGYEPAALDAWAAGQISPVMFDTRSGHGSKD